MITASRLVSGSVLTAAAAVYYSCPLATTAIVKRGDFCNSTGGAVNVTAYIVPSGGNPAASNTLISALSVGAGVTYVSAELSGLVMGPGETLQAFGLGVTFIVSGVLVTNP